MILFCNQVVPALWLYWLKSRLIQEMKNNIFKLLNSLTKWLTFGCIASLNLKMRPNTKF